MRLRVLALAIVLLPALAGSRVSADPIHPPSVEAFGWADGESRRFDLSWNGTLATFSVDRVGSSTYTSPVDCCSDVFDRVRELNPGSSLLFSGLEFNTIPINTTFVDNLNFDLLRAQLDNLVSLTGYVTLDLPADLRRARPTLAFAASQFDEPSDAIPEPSLLLLVGCGLLAAGRAARKRNSA
jgi:hypothetical protein